MWQIEGLRQLPGVFFMDDGNIFGVTSAMLEDPNAVTHTLFGREIAVNGYFTSVLGAPALNMGVFVGIIAGFVGGVAYNKYYNFINCSGRICRRRDGS